MSRASVVIAVRDCERHIGEAIDSVLVQGPLELIVVDDGSSDRSAAVAESRGATVISLDGLGIGPARNAGVAAARGDLIAFVDADDVWCPGKLDAQLAALAADPALEIVYGHVLQFLSPELSQEEAARLVCPDEPQPGYCAGAALIRRAAFDVVGPFAALTTGEFIDWMARAREAGLRETMLEQTVLLRRIHAANHGIVRRHATSDYVRVVKAALDRRRALAAKEAS